MGMFTAISQGAFDELQLDAGMLLRTFDPASPAAPKDEDIITATTGGIQVSCVPTYSDFGEDVDNIWIAGNAKFLQLRLGLLPLSSSSRLVRLILTARTPQRSFRGAIWNRLTSLICGG